MSLPGSPGQLWEVALNLDNHLIERAAEEVTCSVTVDGPSVNTISAAVNEDKTSKFQSLDSGNYSVTLVCTEPARRSPFHAAQAMALWSGYPGEDNKSVGVSIRIDAKRN
jgi:hypothetical protein